MEETVSNERPFYIAWMWRFLAAAIFGVVLLLWPMPSTNRNIAPPDTVPALGLGTLAPGRMVTQASPLDFKLVIGEDLAVTEGQDPTFARVAALDKSTYFADSGHARQLATHPYRFNDALAIIVDTNARKSDCKLTLTLDGSIKSEPLACSDVQENSLARFEFDNVLTPGIYAAQLTSTGEGDLNGIVAYVQAAANGETWVLPFSTPRHLDGLKSFVSWARFAPGAFGLYVVFLLGLGALLVIGAGRRLWPWVAAFGLICGASLMITPQFSGHDETAHIDMLHSALVTSLTQEKGDFYHNARMALINADFFRLNTVGPNPEGTCPHMVLQPDCGSSDHPRWYYGGVAEVVRLMGFKEEAATWSVERLSMVGRLASLLIVVFGLLIVGVAFGKRVLKAVLVVCCCFGGLIAQVASTTNDVPMYMIGIVGVGWLITLAMSTSRLRSFIGLGLMIVLAFVASRIDRSFVAILPIFAGVLLLGRIHHDDEDDEDFAPQIWLRAALSIGACIIFALLVVGIALGVSGVHRLFPFPLEGLLRLDNNIAMLFDLSKVSMHDAGRILSHQLKSVAGTFVWGHSLFDIEVYRIWNGVFAVATIGGLIACGTSARTVRRATLIGVVFGIMLGCQVVFAVAIAAGHMSEAGVVWQAYSKIRLTAPGIVAVMAAFGVGVYWAQRRQLLSSIMFRAVVAWLMILGFYYLPRFYLADVM